MSEIKKSDSKEVKTSAANSEASKPRNENKPKDTKGNSEDTSKTNSSQKSASQTSISHFSSVSTPEYRSGWNKIFGKSDTNATSSDTKSKYERRKDLVAEHWSKYQETKDVEHLAIICREMPFFDHPYVGEEIASLLTQ